MWLSIFKMLVVNTMRSNNEGSLLKNGIKICNCNKLPPKIINRKMNSQDFPKPSFKVAQFWLFILVWKSFNARKRLRAIPLIGNSNLQLRSRLLCKKRCEKSRINVIALVEEGIWLLNRKVVQWLFTFI